MIGIALILVIGAYVWIAKKAVNVAWETSSRLAAFVLAIFILAPSVDAVAGRVVLKKRCARDGKIRVFERVSGVDGLRADSVYESSPQYYGYRFIEGREFRDPDTAQYRVDRAEREGLVGTATLLRRVQPIAKYELVEEYAKRSGYYFQSSHIAVREIDSGHELASFDWIEFRGGWAERFIASFSDAGPGIAAACDAPSKRKSWTFEMLHQALKPTSG